MSEQTKFNVNAAAKAAKEVLEASRAVSEALRKAVIAARLTEGAARETWMKLRDAAAAVCKQNLAEESTTDDLPQFKDHSVDITGGVESAEYVRRLRDE